MFIFAWRPLKILIWSPLLYTNRFSSGFIFKNFQNARKPIINFKINRSCTVAISLPRTAPAISYLISIDHYALCVTSPLSKQHLKLTLSSLPKDKTFFKCHHYPQDVEYYLKMLILGLFVTIGEIALLINSTTNLGKISVSPDLRFCCQVAGLRMSGVVLLVVFLVGYFVPHRSKDYPKWAATFSQLALTALFAAMNLLVCSEMSGRDKKLFKRLDFQYKVETWEEKCYVWLMYGSFIIVAVLSCVRHLDGIRQEQKTMMKNPNHHQVVIFVLSCQIQFILGFAW